MVTKAYDQRYNWDCLFIIKLNISGEVESKCEPIFSTDMQKSCNISCLENILTALMNN